MSGNLCEHCTGMCCRYIALPIDTPEDKSDFDDIRWYIMHRNISVFVEDDDWFLYIAADCRHLQRDFRCGVYNNRPQICRDYTTENCDYHSGEYGWQQHFACPEHLEEYAREFFAGKSPRRAVGGQGRAKPGAKRSRVKVRSSRKLGRRAHFAYANANSDIAGTPLPILEDRS